MCIFIHFEALPVVWVSHRLSSDTYWCGRQLRLAQRPEVINGEFMSQFVYPTTTARV